MWTWAKNLEKLKEKAAHTKYAKKPAILSSKKLGKMNWKNIQTLIWKKIKIKIIKFEEKTKNNNKNNNYKEATNWLLTES